MLMSVVSPGMATPIDTAEEHVTEFCYEITVIDATNAAKNTGNTVGKHNCADKDCP
jgi:hypothetical protein